MDKTCQGVTQTLEVNRNITDGCLILTTLKYKYKPFEYLCYGSMVIIILKIILALGPSLTSESDVYRCQMVTALKDLGDFLYE